MKTTHKKLKEKLLWKILYTW